ARFQCYDVIFTRAVLALRHSDRFPDARDLHSFPTRRSSDLPARRSPTYARPNQSLSHQHNPKTNETQNETCLDRKTIWTQDKAIYINKIKPAQVNAELVR